MQKPIASLMAVGLLLLAACGTGGEVEPGPITSFDDIAGTTYERQQGSPDFIHFFEDGTMHSSLIRTAVVDNPFSINEARFEGTTVFLKEIRGPCHLNPDSIYEIHLLENGNLRFVVVEDPCANRSSFFLAEFVAVP